MVLGQLVPFVANSFFGWEGSPTKIGYRKKGTLTLSSPLEELVVVPWTEAFGCPSSSCRWVDGLLGTQLILVDLFIRVSASLWMETIKYAHQSARC